MTSFPGPRKPVGSDPDLQRAMPGTAAPGRTESLDTDAAVRCLDGLWRVYMVKGRRRQLDGSWAYLVRWHDVGHSELEAWVLYDPERIRPERTE